MRHIIDGSLEIVLIKPVDCLFFLVASTIELDGLGLVVGGAIMFTIAATQVGAITMNMILQFVLLFTAGVFVMMGISLIMAATSFKWVGNSRIPEIFDSIKYFGRYPQNIFPKVITGFSSFIMPVAMVGFFPAAALLGRATLPMFLAVIPCVLFVWTGIILFRHMVHLYEGVGG